MTLARAKMIGRKRRRMGHLWPMPVRETDLGHIYAEITVRPLAGSTKAWKGRVLVDIVATDTFLPASVLRKLGLRERLHENEVTDAWAEIVGEFIAAHSAPVALREGLVPVLCQWHGCARCGRTVCWLCAGGLEGHGHREEARHGSFEELPPVNWAPLYYVPGIITLAIISAASGNPGPHPGPLLLHT